MIGRSMRRWNASGTVLMTLIAAFTLTVGSAPAEAGKKRTLDPEQIVEALIERVDDRMNKLEDDATKLVDDVEKRLDRAVSRARLREVLKADQRAARSMARDLKSFDRATDRDQTKALKALDKLTTDPQHELAVRMAVADALASAQTMHNDLRSAVAERVNTAIDDIQMLLDEGRENLLP